MIPFLRLIRIKNLMAILIAMLGVSYFLHKQNPFEVIDFHPFHYGMLICSTLIIAAAGHIINDYFDLKADRVNKPNSMVLTKYMAKRWAILANWILNILGFLMAVILSLHYDTLIFVFVHLLSINLLWFYSAYWKRKLILGTAVLSALPGLVLFLSCWFFQVLNEKHSYFSSFKEATWSTYLDYRFIYFVAICAFFINLSREIIKETKKSVWITGDYRQLKITNNYSWFDTFEEAKNHLIKIQKKEIKSLKNIIDIYDNILSNKKKELEELKNNKNILIL